jgi:uncharacterized protein (DUF885 family)
MKSRQGDQVMSDAVTSVRELADELFAVVCDQDPMVPTVLGLDGDHDTLADLSEAAEQAFRVRFADIATRAEAIDADDLTAEDRITRAVVIQQAHSMIDNLDSGLTEYTITDLFIAPASTLLVLLPMTALPTAELAEAYLRRLAAIPAHLAIVTERHRQGVTNGMVPVAHLVEAAVRHIDRYLSDPDHDPLAGPTPPDGAVPDFAARRDQVLADVVRPALRTYRDVLSDEILPHGRPADRPGLSWLPGGETIYANLVRVHTTTDRSPEELHQTGLNIIESLRAEYAEIGSRALGTADLGEIFEHLKFDKAMRWTSEDELLRDARAAIERAEEAAPQWFGLQPTQACEVRAVPAADAAGAPAAFYMQPSMDGQRPGVYFANTYQVTERFRHQSEATAFHEAVPGHHFQASITLELPGLPLLRRIADVNAYTEGWGLYCERLADEMGLYSDDIAKLGMLTADSMRAGRLVVDTGLHAKGWSREQAVAYLSEHTPMAAVEIESEVDRYIAYPGQALAYMVGRLEILKIRADAKSVLGDTFDIRGFHDVVLGNGPLPLSVLAGVVADWATAQRTAN